MNMRRIAFPFGLFALLFMCRLTYAQDYTESLRNAVEDPVAPLITVPTTNETLFGGGPFNRNMNVLSLNPTLPFNQDGVNIISRARIPVILKPGFESKNASHAGLGDSDLTFYFSPAARNSTNSLQVTWGLGFIFGFPTATRKDLGSGKWTAGPAAALTFTRKNIVTGATFNALFSYAGKDDRPNVKHYGVEPYIYYNMNKGWYLIGTSRIRADWRAPKVDRWLVPLGGGLGKVFYINKQAVNVSGELFYFVAKPQYKPHPDWGMRFSFNLLFPKDD